jgi:AcrR family transcriptional regulator
MKHRVSKPEKHANSRRIPTQARARERAQRIVDAASHVFAEVGFEAATMEAIAERAETSIGSIYQFFPNKLSLFNALARDYHEKLRAFFDLLLGGPLLEQPWADILDAGIDAFVAFHDGEVGFRAVWVGLQVTPEVVVEGEAINREFARRIEAVLAAKLPGLEARRRPVVATMVVEILTTMLIVSARRPAEAKGLMEEAKLLLRRYLAPYEPTVRKKGDLTRAAIRSAR